MIAPTPTGASFNRGKSKQDYRTPDDFRSAVVKRFGMPTWDLAADASNFFASDCHIDEVQNSLLSEWHNLPGLLWLNPPFEDIAPWAKKCYLQFKLGAQILLLVPASVGSMWFANWVDKTARVYFLNPRLCFDGKNPYPKDCILASYGYAIPGYEVWRWK